MFGVNSLRLHIDIREMDTRSSLSSTAVPKEKSNLFKIRQNVDKVLVLGVSQLDESCVPLLRVVKCVSIGMAYGRYLSPGDVTELVANAPALAAEEAAAYLSEAGLFATKALWSPRAAQFEGLNTVTDRGLVHFPPSHFHPPHHSLPL